MKPSFFKIAGLAALGIAAIVVLSILVKALLLLAVLLFAGRAAMHLARRGRTHRFGPYHSMSHLGVPPSGYGPESHARQGVQAYGRYPANRETIVPVY